jgi:diaminopimelate epimerase
MTEVPFAKYQAAGNDFVLLGDVPLSQAQVRALCDRRQGIGADGVICVTQGADATVGFKLANADGSVAEISGNGLRCLAASMYDRGALQETSLSVRTAVGVRYLTVEVEDGRAVGATVDMGAPRFALADVPMKEQGETFVNRPLRVTEELTLPATALSMGNPHVVLFTDGDPITFGLDEIGPLLETDERFPEGTNVEVARVHDLGIDARVWERGVGETLSCGTGACAIAVAANESGLAPERVSVAFPGGTLTVERTPDGRVLLGGPVEHVFDGVVEIG